MYQFMIKCRFGKTMALLGFLCTASALWSQNSQGTAQPSGSELPALIGLDLEELIAKFGVPGSVRVDRGSIPAEDDVVFVYPDQAFYVWEKRVWMIEVKAAYGVKIGDSPGMVFLVLGDGVQEYADHFLYPLPSQMWPLMLRVNFTPARHVSAIYIFRSDF
jgi:hypothetical protein